MKMTRKKVENLTPYRTKDLPFEIKLDANEGKNILAKNMYQEIIDGFSSLNLYPDDDSRILKEKISDYMGAPQKNLIVGNGSSEMIELLMKTYVDDGDKVVSFDPSFSMYKVFTQIYGGDFIGVETKKGFEPDWEELEKTCQRENPKLVFICNPNNPTGKLLDPESILNFAKNTDSIVVWDEAYIEFSGETPGGLSLWKEALESQNLVVIRTLSKALGLAGIRVGYMVACQDMLSDVKKVKSPYNLNSLSQYVAAKSLEKAGRIGEYIESVKEGRSYLYKELSAIEEEVFESEANFILFKSRRKDLFERLASKKILIRSFSGGLDGYYRVSVGSQEENKKFIQAMKEID